MEEVKKLLKAGKSINSQDAFGATPLLVAMVSGKEEVVDFNALLKQELQQNHDQNVVFK